MKKTEEIKIGGVYDVRVKVIKKTASALTGQVEIGAYTVDLDTNLPMEYEMSWFLGAESPAFAEITPKNGVPNSETAPKYDPNRLFKKGDKVRVVEWNGRNYYDLDHNTKLETGCIAEISDDEEAEQQEGYVSVIFQDYIRYVPPCYLELVTPVEELGPYRVRHNKAHDAWSIYGPFDLSAVNYFYGERYPYTSETAKHAAEAECARLNAEYRKEQK